MSHYNEALKSVLNELDSFNIPYTLENGSKHIRVRYEIAGQNFQCIAGRSLSVSWRNVRNALSDVRGHLRQAGVLETKEKPCGEFSSMNEISCLSEGNLEIIGGVPRMRDTDIGRALGFTRPDNVRNLIKSNLQELKRYGAVTFAPKQTSERGGRPSEAYLLNKEQSLLIALLSRTTEAANVRQHMIKVFSDYEDHHMNKAIPATAAAETTAPAEPEILLNAPAIAAIAKAVTDSLNIGGVSATASQKYLTEDRFREAMEQMLRWQQAQFIQLKGSQEGGKSLSHSSDKEFVERLESTANRIMTDVQKQISVSTDVISRAMERIIASTAAAVEVPIQEVETLVDSIIPTIDDDEIVASGQDTSEPEYMLINDIYKMAGIDPRLIRKRQSLSLRMSYALEKYSISKGLPPIKARINGLPRKKYHKEAIEGFYKSKGRRMLSRYVIA